MSETVTYPHRTPFLAAPNGSSGGGSSRGGGDDDSNGSLEVLRYRIGQQERRHDAFAKEIREEHREQRDEIRRENDEIKEQVKALADEFRAMREWILRVTGGAIAVAAIFNLAFAVYLAFWKTHP